MKKITLLKDQCLRALPIEAIIYPVFEDKPMREHFKERLNITEDDIDRAFGKVTTMITSHLIQAKKVYFVGLGKFEALTTQRLKEVLLPVFKEVEGKVALTLSLFHQVFSDEILTKCIVETYEVYTYQFNKITNETVTDKQSELVLLTIDDVEKYVEEASIIAKNINLARDLGNMPSNLLTPTVFKNHIQQFAEAENLQHHIYSKHDLEKLGAHAILAVGKASEEEAYLIHVQYQGNPNSNENVALVGKGITFDTGGYSLKPAASMKSMKFDMCGAANMFATFKALVELKAKVNVQLIIATCENMVDGKGLKVDDVIQTLSGKTVEVTNTDAEGRLILCDALAYACQHHATKIIDMATLTGSCMVALGNEITGVFTNDDHFYHQIEDAVKKSDEKIWRLPIGEPFLTQLKATPYADLDNAPTRFGGASVAATFLSQFVKDTTWMHLDIAGPGSNDAATKTHAKGATGVMVKTLVTLLHHD